MWVEVEQPLLPLGHAVSLGLMHRLPFHYHGHLPILQDPVAGRDVKSSGDAQRGANLVLPE